MNTDEQSSSSYTVLAPLQNAFYTNMNHSESMTINDRILSIINDRLDDAQQYKDAYHRNPMQPLLFDILQEMKHKHGK